ncbi:MAG TPA: hypothetical protein PKE26_12330, partial [Kiritimatiellia bacterium]|nr:hypothetical protein [Kiritimatiellia bacterium]
MPPAPRAAFDAVWEPGGKPSAGSRLSQRVASGVVAGGAVYRPAPPAPPCWPPVADDQLDP